MDKRYKIARLTRIISLIILVALLLTSCISTEKQQAQTEDKIVLTILQEEINPKQTKLLEKIFDIYMAQNPNIVIELNTIPRDPDSMKEALEEGNDVDLFSSGGMIKEIEWYYEPLNKYINKWSEWDSFAEDLKKQIVSPDENIYVIPDSIYNRALFYRRDWFKEAGLEPPTTWDEFYDIALKFYNPKENRYGYAFRGVGVDGYLDMTILSYLDPVDFNASDYLLTRDGGIVYEKPGAIKAMKLYKKLYDISPKESIDWNYLDTVDMFCSGQTAMLIQDSEVISMCRERMSEGTWATVPLPTGPSGKMYYPLGFTGWCMTSYGTNKEEAWKLLSFMMQEETNMFFNKNYGTIPVHEAAKLDPFFSEGFYKAYIDMRKRPFVYVGYYDQHKSKVEYEESNIHEMLLGNITPEQCAQNYIDIYYTYEKTDE